MIWEGINDGKSIGWRSEKGRDHTDTGRQHQPGFGNGVGQEASGEPSGYCAGCGSFAGC